MKISKVRIQNVRGIDSLTFAPALLNYITGPSGSGKSSVMDAIRYGITGKSHPDHIRLGEFEASVSLEFDRIGEVQRSVDIYGKSKVRMNDKSTTAKSVAEQISSAFGITSESIGLMTSSDLLMHALGKDLAAYLLNSGFLTNEMTMSQLLALSPMEKDVVDELKKHLPCDPKAITLQDIDEAYGNIKNSRPALKRMLAEERVLSAATVMKPKKTCTELEKDIAALRVKIATEQQHVKAYPAYLREVEKLAQSISDTEKKLKAYESVKPVTKREKELAQQNLDNASALVSSTYTAIQMTKQDIETMQKTLDALDTSVCPISRSLVCMTDKSSVRAELNNALMVKRDSLASLQEKFTTDSDSKEAARMALYNVAEQENQWNTKIGLVSELEKLRDIKIPEVTPPNPEALAELERLLSAAESELNQAKQYEETLAHTERAEALAKSLSIAETLVKELAPNGGIRKLVLSNSIGPLEDWCNERMKDVLPQYRLRFDAADNFNIVAETTPGKQISFASMSTGEQLQAIFIIMCMLNELNGVRIILLDNLNALDSDAITEFLKLAVTLSESYDHMFISGIDQGDFASAISACSIPSRIIKMG